MICHIYPVAAAGGTFQWKWRGKDGKRKTERTFELFYDCVEDARDHGVAVDLTQVHLDIADASESSKLVAQPKS
jgi:PAS domain-containing protein